jgi:hypothetical protein
MNVFNNIMVSKTMANIKSDSQEKLIFETYEYEYMTLLRQYISDIVHSNEWLSLSSY